VERRVTKVAETDPTSSVPLATRSDGDDAASAVPAPAEPEQAAADEAGDGAATSEEGGPTGPEPTRYGDWERKGRCIDF